LNESGGQKSLIH